MICSNISESAAYGLYISQLIRYARDCSSYGDYIDRERLLTRKLFDQGYMLESLFSKVVWSIQWSGATLQYSHFSVLHDLLPIDACYIPRIWLHRIWLILLLIPRRVRGHITWSLLFSRTYSHTWRFPECSCWLQCNIYSSLCHDYSLMIFN